MKKTAVAVAAIFMVVSMSAFAAPNYKQCKGVKGKPHGHYFMKLQMKQLNSDQKAKLMQIRKDATSKAVPLIKELRIAKIQLRAQMVKPNATYQSVQPLVEKITKIQGELLANRVQATMQTYNQTGVLLPMRR